MSLIRRPTRRAWRRLRGQGRPTYGIRILSDELVAAYVVNFAPEAVNRTPGTGAAMWPITLKWGGVSAAVSVQAAEGGRTFAGVSPPRAALRGRADDGLQADLTRGRRRVMWALVASMPVTSLLPRSIRA